MNKKKIINRQRVLASLAIALSILALVAAPALGAGNEKALNIALAEEPDNLNPISDANAYDTMKIYSGLVKSDENLQMAPDLAESWEASADGKSYIFHLKNGVKWQDGTDFTAEDVLFTYETVKDDKWVSVFPVSSEYKNIEDISIVDPSTVKFTLKEGIVPFLERFASAHPAQAPPGWPGPGQDRLLAKAHWNRTLPVRRPGSMLRS